MNGPVIGTHRGEKGESERRGRGEIEIERQRQREQRQRENFPQQCHRRVKKQKGSKSAINKT